MQFKYARKILEEVIESDYKALKNVERTKKWSFSSTMAGNNAAKVGAWHRTAAC